MSFPRYPSYKDSGVEWLGEVPGHWSVEPFKRQIDRNDGGVWGDDPDGANDTIVLRSTEQTVDGHWKLDDPASRKLSESEISGSLLAENDLLLTKSSGSSLHIGKTTLVTSEIAAMRCCYSNFMQRIRLKPTFLPKLAWHIMNNDLARLQFDLLSNSSTGLANLNATMVGQIVFPVPPLPEQTQIATFLDRETAKIDELVAEQRRLMELLKEKRQAVISHAVTQGLNPHAPMKPSGIEWLGDVPEHWKIIRLAYSAVIENGTTPSRENQDYWLDGDIPWLSSGEVNQYRITEANEFITSIALDECSLRLLPKKTIVLGMIGQGKTRGLSASLEIEACINQNLAAIVPGKNLESDYLLYIFQSVYDYLREFGRGGNQAALNCEILSAFKVPIPPLEEQFQIRDYLEARVKEFDTLTAEAQRAIDLLQERRTALISAAVTGQIDLRGTKIKARAVQYY